MSTDPNWLLVLVYLASGFVLLAKGADWLVGGSSQVARRIGVSTLVVGLTVIAYGTSAPEVVVSAVAANDGMVDLSLGNVLGSNVANIGLVLGACAVVLPRVLEARLPVREVFWLFASLLALWMIARDGTILRFEAALLLGIFLVYTTHVLLSAREGAHPVEAVGEYRRPILWATLGMVAIAMGAKLAVMGAQAGATRLGVPESVIGLTVVAIGTSLPELAAGLGGAIKGESDISLGNVVGSNVFNLLAVVGIVGLVQPFDPAHAGIQDAQKLSTAFDKALGEDLWVVLGFSLAAVVLPQLGPAGAGRAKGALLLVAYFSYGVWLYVSRALPGGAE